MTREQIDEGCRQLVRQQILHGCYTWTWTDGRHWTICPREGRTRTYTRVEMIDYLTFAGGLAA